MVLHRLILGQLEVEFPGAGRRLDALEGPAAGNASRRLHSSGTQRHAPGVTREDLAERRSRALHRAIAQRIRHDPTVVPRARARVLEWRANGGAHAHYCDAWEAVLDRPTDAIVAFLESEGDLACELRQVSPFAGVLDARERWRVLRELKVAP